MNDARCYKRSKFNYFGNQCCCCATTRHYEVNENVFLLVFVNIKNNFDKTIKLNDVFDVTAQTFVVTTGKSQESDETF